jgi:predicted nucleotidyltransferase
MKRSTALKNATEIARRIKSVNGLLATPLCNREAVRIKRAWVFGSTVKGSGFPNDLDILLELIPCGRIKNWRQAKLDRRYYRSTGIKLAQCSMRETIKWLRKNMKKVRCHHYFIEKDLGIDVMVEIYPRFLLTL